MRRIWVMGVCAMAAAACGPAEKTNCNDGLDNDGDGLIDDGDPGCAATGDLEAPDPPQCGDGFDNDDDGLTDFPADPGCTSADDFEEQDPIGACNNGEDDDGDGRVDFPDDTGCDSPVDPDEYNPAACEDGLDNDGDQRIDYPNDPGCELPTDDDETTPDPVPACSNGEDDDGDERTDYPADPGCNSAADVDEFNSTPGACGPLLDVTDISASGEAMGVVDGPRANELSSATCNGYGGEFAYTYSVVGGPVSLVISTDHPETTLDTVVYLRTECRDPASEIGCDDDTGVAAFGRSSRLVIPTIDTGTYYVVVDSYGPGSQGAFKLTVEERVAEGGGCDPADPMPCVDGLVCREVTPGAGYTCEVHVCEDGVDNDGDGAIDFPDEPGCTSLTDDDETDPVPAPECGNGIDDDGDGLTDFAGGDPGCLFAADTSELDECITGVAVESHLGGAVTGTTVGGSNALTAPAGCGFSTGTAPERVYVFNNAWTLTELVFDTTGSALDTVLYVRPGDCAVPGAAGMCNDNTTGTASRVVIADAAPGYFFAIVDGKSTVGGAFALSITGEIPAGAACPPGDTAFVCEPGYVCDGTCVPTECNDGVDNADPEDTLADVDDPGCASALDDDETDPAPLPQCANGADDDGDGLTDYPADPGCQRAGDDDEEDCVVLESFDAGWPSAGWLTVSGGTFGTVSAANAHDGGFGLGDAGWIYKATPAFGAEGAVLSAWIRPGTGRTYFGFNADGAGCKSFVLAPNTGDIRFQDNPAYGFVELTTAPFSFTASTWYFVEVEFMAGNVAVGRVLDGPGGTVLGSVTHTFADSLVGGVAYRSFSSHAIDTIGFCGGL